MDASDFRFFEAVARAGGVSRAAAELETVQSNVTTRIRLLEGRLGVSLFERHSRGATLTDAGCRLLPYARRLRGLLRDAQRATQDEGKESGTLTIGSVPSTSAVRLAPLLPKYIAMFPKVDLELRTGTTEQLVSQILDYSLEGAFVCGPIVHADLRSEVVCKEELVLVSSVSKEGIEALVQRDEIRALVMGTGCTYRKRLDAVISRHGAVHTRHIEFDSLDTIVGCVAAGLGVTILPRSVVSTYRPTTHIAVHRLHPDDAKVEILFVRHCESPSWRALEVLVRLVRMNSPAIASP
jgi:DNA-binding transcriptional LysR family regulator